MDNNDQLTKSTSVIKVKTDEEDDKQMKKVNIKGKKLSFSQASDISEDTKENHKLSSPVSKVD